MASLPHCRVGILNATLTDLMVFATVFDQVPLLGFEKQPKNEFSARNTLPTDSTSGPPLQLPLNIGQKQFTEKMTFTIYISHRALHCVWPGVKPTSYS